MVVDLSKQDHAEGQDHGHAHVPGHGEHEHGHEHGPFLIPEEAHKYVPHRHGLNEDDIQGVFEGAGLESFHFDEEAVAAMQHGKDVKLFIARGIKPVV